MKKRILITTICFLLISIIILLTIKTLNIISFKCTYKDIFNIYCAGCGTTRMIEALLDLKIYQAFRYNPIIFIYTIITGIYILLNTYSYIKNNKLIFPSKKTILVLVIILIIYMILRNIPYFDFLVPTTI